MPYRAWRGWVFLLRAATPPRPRSCRRKTSRSSATIWTKRSASTACSRTNSESRRICRSRRSSRHIIPLRSMDFPLPRRAWGLRQGREACRAAAALVIGTALTRPPLENFRTGSMPVDVVSPERENPSTNSRFFPFAKRPATIRINRGVTGVHGRMDVDVTEGTDCSPHPVIKGNSARIIHEQFYCNPAFAAATSLHAVSTARRRAGSPLSRSPYRREYASLPRGSARPSRDTTAGFRHEPS